MAKVSIDVKSGKLNNDGPIVGIDLGTTNSLVAIIDRESGEAKALKGAGVSVIVPSLLHFTHSGEAITGREAAQFLVESPERTVYSVKRLMGKSYGDIKEHEKLFSYKIIDEEREGLVKVRIGNRFYTPIELSALILKELKHRAEQELNTEVRKAVITVPAYFNDAQRQATRDAGKLAGLEILRIVNEPTAAALAYGMGLDKSETRHIAVYDLGGGTFDISILRISGGIFDVLSTHGDTYLGGDDFDRAIYTWWSEQYGLDDLSDQEVQRLRLAAEEAKRHLSTADLFSRELELTGRRVLLQLDADRLRQLCAPVIDQSLRACRIALKDSGLERKDLDEVILVGGSTKSRAVKEAVAAFFEGVHINDSLNPDEVVALGAAVEADILAGNRKDLLLLDVTPLSLGIETLGGLMDVVIPRNSKIPASVGKQYTTSVDGQVNLKISVFQGERELVSENRKLGEFVLKGIPAMPAGMPKIRISFMLNADGILKVEALEERSGTVQEIEVKPQYGLTDEELEKMLLDSITHAESDVKIRLLLEAQNEARQLVYTTERFLEKHGEMLSDPEIQQTALLVNDLRNSIESSDKDIILSLVEELNEYTRPFAERLMDISVSKALKGKNIES